VARIAARPLSSSKRPQRNAASETGGRLLAEIIPSASVAATFWICGPTPATTIAGGRSTGKVSWARAPGR
jgi:hypothetical protein